MMRTLAAALALAGLLTAVPADAVDRLVDDHLVPCTLDAVPIHDTISGAVGAASPGETILVCPGTYDDEVTVDKANLTLRAQGLVQVVPTLLAIAAFVVVSPGVTIQGFDISGYHGCGVFVVAAGAESSSSTRSAEQCRATRRATTASGVFTWTVA